MKTKKLKQLTIYLFLLPLCVVLFGAGCDNEIDKNYENVPLEYTKCPCDSEKSFIEEVAMNEILLFDTTKTTFSEMQELSLVGDNSLFVSYNPQSNNAIFYSYTHGGIYESISYICNFPEAASEWEMPYNGIYVSYSADAFESCDPNGSIEFFYSEFEIVLTSLKKYDK